MKKIYEAPVVELTKFDVEDVITASMVEADTNTVNDVVNNRDAFGVTAENDANISVFTW